LNATLETILGLDNAPPPTLSEDDLSPSTPKIASAPKYRNVVFRKAGIAIERVALTLLAVGVSILIPEFSSMMGFLGAFNAFVLCVIGPVGAKIAMSGRCEKQDAALFVVASAMAIWGTFSVWRTAIG
jgi:vesicular inhibitory amino acid transporter